jgi:hypothetical protein
MYKQRETEHTSQQLYFTGDQGPSVLARSRHAAEDAMLLGPTRIPESEEVLIVDGRANLGPAEQVENKLSNLLRSSPIPVSHVRMTARFGARRSC